MKPGKNDQWAQLEMNLPLEHEHTVLVRVMVLPNGQWMAQISSGWWIGYGKNRDSAVRSVIERWGCADVACG